jgi:RNA polymerase sigma factor (sigma-70 family)
VVTGDLSDAEVVIGSWQHPDQFGELFRRHYAAVHGFTVGLVGRSVGADLAAEVFVRAFAVRRRFNPAYSSARPWLMGIASNLVAGYYRSQARENRALRRLAKIPPSDDPFEDAAVARVDAQQLNRLISAAFGSLRREEAEVVSLFVYAGLSYAEIAVALAIPEGTVRSRLSRARERLRNLIEGFDESSADESRD